MGSARRSFIGGTKLPESKRAWLGLAAVSVALSCGSGPRVSPWGPGGTVPLRFYAEAPDLDARRRSIDDETAALGLRLESETAIADRSGTRFLVRGYVGDDSLGRPVHATRVAS
ncbi:MAG TPA: hypothetical protein VL400_17875, partial [Polyangiaceae bacterium]|nr:hypothetical protein [Polyangiaceae bacterium]